MHSIPRSLIAALLPCLFLARVAPAADNADIVIADFEGPAYGDWATTGEAFGPGPAQGTLPSQMAVTGFQGKGLVNSYFKGDGTQGTLTSPPITIQRKFINFLIGGGHHPDETCINLLVDGKTVRTETGPDSEHLDWASWNVADLAGKQARIEIVDKATGGWGHINIDQIEQSDRSKVEPVDVATVYRETYRPQFHFTAKKGWLNDPNGLVFYQGEYHLFFQHNPKGTEWGNMTWGHAVSPDLVHWEQLPNSIEPDKLGTIFSGSAVVDWNNTAGFAQGNEKTLVAMYTAAGNPFTQCIAYSTDRGRTFTKFANNPVLPHIAGSNRDPKLVWHEPTKKWILALYTDGTTYALFNSTDLKSFTHLQDIAFVGGGECPDFFPMPIDGDHDAQRWVLTAANGQYLVGSFDGTKFTPEGDKPLRVEYGRNCYAVQTYSDIPAADGRRIQVGWMNGGSYPHMPFNQQMSFPCTLTLHKTPEGLRLTKYPVKEIELLRGAAKELKNETVTPDKARPVDVTGDLFDIEAEFEPGGAKEYGLRVRGEPIVFRADQLHALGDAPFHATGSTVKLRVLVDRTSIEAYADGGRVALSSCFLPPRTAPAAVEIFATGGPVKVVAMQVHELKSAWPEPK